MDPQLVHVTALIIVKIIKCLYLLSSSVIFAKARGNPHLCTLLVIPDLDLLSNLQDVYISTCHQKQSIAECLIMYRA